MQSEKHTLNTQAFIGQPVGDLLTSIQEPFESYFFFDHKPGLLAGAGFKYSDGRVIRVKVETFDHLQQFNARRDWDIEQFKRETIAAINVEE